MSHQKPFGWVAALVCGLFALMLTHGCGSGGGGGNAYEGNREAARITDENAALLAAAAYDSQSLEGPFGSFASANAGGGTVTARAAGRPAALAVARLLAALAREVHPPQQTALPAVRALGVEESLIVEGDCGGSAELTFLSDETLGTLIGDFAFDAYCDDGTVLDGRAVFEARVDPDTDALDYFTFTFSSLGGTADGDSFALDGSLTLRQGAEATELLTTMDLLFSNGTTGEALWLNDLTISVTQGVDNGQAYEEIAFSGRVYHSVHGYVDIRTDVPFRIEGADDHPSEGVMVLTGADQAKILMTVISNTQYQIEADLDGDDTYDWGPETFDWDA